MNRSTRFSGLLRLAAMAALAAAGCGQGSNHPSGFTSPAANFGGAASSSRPGGGTTGGTTGGAQGNFRMIAWDGSQILPGNQASTWIFFENKGKLRTTTLDVLVNGTGIGQNALTPQMFPIANGTGNVIILSPPPAAGATLQVTAKDAQGNPVSSNVVHTKTTPIPVGNMPTSAPPFQTLTPKNGDQHVGTGPDFTFTVAGQATTYNINVWELGIDPNTGKVGIADIPVSVEVAPAGSGPQKFTTGTTPSMAAFANIFLNQPGSFVWFVVALDQDGWGVGTSIDVPGFNAAGSGTPPQAVSDTWPNFMSN